MMRVASSPSGTARADSPVSDSETSSPEKSWRGFVVSVQDSAEVFEVVESSAFSE